MSKCRYGNGTRYIFHRVFTSKNPSSVIRVISLRLFSVVSAIIVEKPTSFKQCCGAEAVVAAAKMERPRAGAVKKAAAPGH